MTITKPPENGEARVIDRNTIPTYTAPNPRTKCNERSVKAKGVLYTPTKAGSDEIEEKGWRTGPKVQKAGLMATGGAPISRLQASRVR
jgi:hypothetical protein